MYIVSNPFYEYRFRFYWVALLFSFWKSRRIQDLNYRYSIKKYMPQKGHF